MTGVSSVDSNYDANIVQDKTTNDVTDKDDFLKMLLAQLENQDPLNPMDGTDFTAQLAQFSSLEQLTNINNQLDLACQQQDVLSEVQSLNLIGKEVMAAGNGIEVNGNPVEIAYNLSEDIEAGRITIYRSDGSTAETIEVGNQGEGDNTVTWDCGTADDGFYTFDVYAENINGDPVSVKSMITGPVTEVNFKDGTSSLIVNGKEVFFENVIYVRNHE